MALNEESAFTKEIGQALENSLPKAQMPKVAPFASKESEQTSPSRVLKEHMQQVITQFENELRALRGQRDRLDKRILDTETGLHAAKTAFAMLLTNVSGG